MTVTVIRGGELLDQTGRRRGDVVVDDESGLVVDVVAPGPGTRGTDDLDARDHGDWVLDAESCLVVPAFVDLNTHLRQPGHEAAGTVDSGTRAAALGGYSALVAMPDTDPCTDNAAVVSEVLALASGTPCQVVPSAALTIGRRGSELAPYGELAGVGVRLFTDSASAVQDPTLLRHALEYLRGVSDGAGIRLIAAQGGQHEALNGDGVMDEGEWSSRLGLAGQPALAEELMVSEALALARLAGCPLHLQQLSTAAAVDRVRAAKADGQSVTAEVSPHHLVLNAAAVSSYDPNLKTCPPLRTPADVAALVEGVADGTIDAIATGHTPHTMDAKEQPFDRAPFGVLGLETALAVLLSETRLSIEHLLPALSWQPAAIVGIGREHATPIEPGRPANLTVIDPAAQWTVGIGCFGGYAANSPFLGRTLTGRVRHTIHRGVPVVTDQQLNTDIPSARRRLSSTATR